MKPTKLKEALKGKLTEKEILILKRAFDTVGDIAIIEIPDELIKKEKLIASKLLELHKNINVVCKKVGIHEGTYRTQKLKILAGEKRKETIHKENGVELKLDIEKVYYSPRSSTERKRIMGQVKKGEEVLVMFSGCAPFPCVLAKNTEAGYVYGVELNEVAHRYGLENVKKNKLSNVFLIHGDVREKVPNFYRSIIGLKTAIKNDELYSRMKYDPDLIEIHTFWWNFTEKFSEFKKTIKGLVEDGKHVVVHQPLEEPRIDMLNSSITNEAFSKMIELIRDYNVDLVIHLNETKYGSEDYDTVKRNMQTFRKYYKNIYFENGNFGIFRKYEEIVKIIKMTGIPNICIDTCHLLHVYSPDEMIDVVKKLKKQANTYFHISDYNHEQHGKEIFEDNLIDLERLLPLVNKGIVEVRSKDEAIAKEMIKSWQYLKNFKREFDRVLMPLPKSAEDFLDVAIPAVKKGGILHFYDFLEEGSFDLAVEKIEKVCSKFDRKCNVKDIVKCGQFGPRIFRICVDVEIN